MRTKKRHLAWLMAVLAVFTLLAAACSSDDDSGDTSSDDSAVDGGDASSSDVSGEVNISGSSTVEPISVAVAESFADVSPDVAVNVDGPGTSDGFELFCAGETDINDASRPIKEEEVTACADGGVEFIELEVAFDGITVMTNPANDAVSCLSLEDLYALSGPESEGFENWNSAQELAAELGSDTEFPDAPFDMTAPGEESGTYGAYIELGTLPPAEVRVEEGAITEEQSETLRPDYTTQANDNAIIQAMEGSDSSFGFVGFAFAEEAGDAIKEIEISGEDGTCVAPTAETIADGSYPLSRSLFIYVNKAAAEENPALSAYVDYYLSDGLAEVSSVGYIDLPQDRVDATLATWEAMTTGTTAGG